MNPIYVSVFVILCCTLSDNDARKTSPVITLHKSSPEVRRAAYFAVFELQSQNGMYITLRSIDDAKKQIFESGHTTMYYLTVNLSVVENGVYQAENCDLVIKDNPNRDPFNSFVSKQCDGVLGQLQPPIMVVTNAPVTNEPVTNETVTNETMPNY